MLRNFSMRIGGSLVGVKAETPTDALISVIEGHRDMIDKSVSGIDTQMNISALKRRLTISIVELPPK